jgi:hypothetical protein
MRDLRIFSAREYGKIIFEIPPACLSLPVRLGNSGTFECILFILGYKELIHFKVGIFQFQK